MTDASDAAISTVVFDLGNVLVSWWPERLYRRLIDDPGQREAFLRDVCSPSWNNAQDRGASTVEATAQLQARHPEQAELIAAFYGNWWDMISGPLPATVDVLSELRAAGIRLLALTNWPADTFGPARERFPFFNWFDGIVVSGEEGLAKPDDEIFQRLIDRYDVNPAETVFLDDTVVHVETARRLGMTGFVFTDAASLRRDLAGVGLPVRADVDVRPAELTDLPELTAIYNYYVVNTAVTFDLDELTVEQRRTGWFDHYAPTGPHRLLVATRGGRVVGYATSSQFRPKRAYESSVEVTIYLAPDAGGLGIGSMLYQQLFSDLQDEDLHRAYAGISLPNPASEALHRRFGFSDVGTLHEAGRKHGQWWDVRYMERPLP